MNLNAVMTEAIAIAHAAGAILRDPISRPRYADHKGAIVDLVTEADRASEAFILARLQAAFPQHRIVGEEGSDYQPAAANGLQWYVDPLDGTTNFAHGIPHFSISLALTNSDGFPIVGVVYDPMRDECFAAVQGGGATLNEQPIQVSTTQHLAASVVASGFPYDKWTDPENNATQWGHFVVRSQGVRRMGSAALDLAYVGAGRYDGYWEQKLQRWDVLAGILIVQEAGGRVTDYTGDPQGVIAPRPRLVASNGYIHDEMLQVLHYGDNAPHP